MLNFIVFSALIGTTTFFARVSIDNFYSTLSYRGGKKLRAALLVWALLLGSWWLLCS